MQVDTVPLATLLIARLVLISVSWQNLFNGGEIIILVFIYAQCKFEILNTLLYLDPNKSSLTEC